MSLIRSVERWAAEQVDLSTTVVTAGWPDRADFGGPWVSVGMPEALIAPAQMGAAGGPDRWEMAWTVRVYVGPGEALVDPAEAWDQAWATVKVLLDGIDAGRRPQVGGTWWADPAAVVVDEEYSEAAGTVVLGLDLTVMTAGWEEV